MMQEITNGKKEVVFGNDDIVIVKYISGIKGGRNLDMTSSGITDSVVKAGHVIITDGNGNYKPMPVASGGSAYAALPEGHKYVGVLYRSVLASKPMASIMTNGEVNPTLVPYPMTSIESAFKTAVPTIAFMKDEIA